MQQSNTSGTIGIILDRRHFSWYPKLITLKVDNTISAFSATATMADCNLTLVIATGMLLQLNGQRLFWLCLRNLFECRDRHPATPRRCWFILSYWHLFIPYAFNISIVCPSSMVTIAFFHSRASTGRGAAPRRRIHLGLPGMRITFTLI